MTKTKRFISILAICAVCLGSLPVVAFAQQDTSATATDTSPTFKWEPGQIFMYYTYDNNGFFKQTGIELDPKEIALIRQENSVTNLSPADITLSLKSMDQSKREIGTVAIKNVEYTSGKYLIADERSDSGKKHFTKMNEDLNKHFKKQFRYSERYAPDVAVEATLEFGKGESKTTITVQGKLVLRLVHR